MTSISKSEQADALREAVRVIERDGWCQNALQDQEGRVCLYGSLAKALNIEINLEGLIVPISEAARNQYLDYLDTCCKVNQILGMLGSSWNDSEGRTEEDVKKFLLETADKIEVSA